MKIKLENGNTMETIEPNSPSSRGRRAKMCELFDVKYGRKLTEEEEKVIESFMANHKDPEAFKKEYNCIWLSSSEEEENKNES